jgi:2-hydroxy-3-keto-5-methylthiopentenyl-1-phosphate phosphatase
VTPAQKTILQIDFDGTVVVGDASTGIMAYFLGEEWQSRVEAASAAMKGRPEATDLIDTMTEGYALLGPEHGEHLAFVCEAHPVRPGLKDLVETAARLDIECRIVSNGFEFYILDYLRAAGITGRVEVHSGHEREGEPALVYTGPDGVAVRGDFKPGWSRHLRARCDRLIYVGDGTSDVPAARLAQIVFARDALFSALKSDYDGELRNFEDLHDVSRGLEDICSRGLRASLT